MEIFEFNEQGFKVLMQFEGWKIGMLRYCERFSAHNGDERHLETDEAFVLLEGSAVLYEEEKEYVMEKCKVYNIKKGMWHHIVVSPDAYVMVIENSNTSAENTERKCYP